MPILMGNQGGEPAGPVRPAWMEATPGKRLPDGAWGGPEQTGAQAKARGRGRGGIFETCANPDCGSGWLHLWRGRQAPVFEGGWSCSAACTGARVAAAARRELEGRGKAQEIYRHRIPLGLVMLEQGWISTLQLRQALDAQRMAGGRRLGYWLVNRQGISEQLVTRALGLQWSCPVLGAESYDAEALAALLPRLLVEARGALPLRVAAGKLLYLGFEDRLDPVVALGIERMSGLRVESGLVPESVFAVLRERLLSASFPAVERIEAASEPALVAALTRAIERARPAESRLVRVHDCLWLRMWREAQGPALPAPGAVQDLIGTIGVV